MRHPPPCTMIGFMPTSRSSATSRAKPSFSTGSTIAPPPKRMISVDAWNARMNGSASARILAFCGAEMGAVGICGEGVGEVAVATQRTGEEARGPRHEVAWTRA